MKKKSLTLLFTLLLFSSVFAQKTFVPTPPSEGPGSFDYKHDQVLFHDYAENPDGFWLFEPTSPKPDSAHVVVFNHGYGAYNPMIYGRWIKHIVKKGNIVIFPRYQKNLWTPRPNKFSKNVSQAIRDALKVLGNGNFVKPITDKLALVGHSYGGVVAADLAVNFEHHEIPQPQAVFLCSPGSGPLKGGLLKSYEGIPEDTQLLIMVSENDHVVGQKFGKKVFKTAEKVRQRNLIWQYHDNTTSPPQYAGHNECYSLDYEYDTGIRNGTTKRAIKKNRLNNVDYHGYWKLLDALLDCSRNGDYCEFALGNTPEQRSLGKLADGTPLKELKIIVPTVPTQPSISAQ
ncbi:MAG: hypothetical protein AAF573_06155 [Bacteroidota bacterium]